MLKLSLLIINNLENMRINERVKMNPKTHIFSSRFLPHAYKHAVSDDFPHLIMFQCLEKFQNFLGNFSNIDEALYPEIDGC